MLKSIILFMTLATLLTACKPAMWYFLGVENAAESATEADTESIEEVPINEPYHFECLILGEDEYLVPRSEVYLVMNEKKIKVGDSQSCRKIEPEEYHNFEIPESAFDACGGWYAGSGDYYYAIYTEEGIEVYGMVLDEGNHEEEPDMEWILVYYELF